jgi:flagellar biosynthesis GTPase FlhF
LVSAKALADPVAEAVVAIGTKMKMRAFGHVSDTTFISALRARWAAFLASTHPVHPTHSDSLHRDLTKDDCVAALGPLVSSLRSVRRRILTNTLLTWATLWFSCILATLIVVAAFIMKLAVPLILAGALAAVGIAALAIWTWRARPSIYGVACRLDSAAALNDRLSTALCFGTLEKPEGLLGLQRDDAVRRLSKVDPARLFPVRLPAHSTRAFVLFLAVCGLFIYRLNYKPPMVALMQGAARSQLVQSILSPLVSAVEKDIQKTIALATSQPETAPNDVRPDSSKPLGDDLWQQDEDDKDANAEDAQQNSQDATIADQQPQQSNPNGQAQTKDGEAQQQEAGQQQSQQDGKKSSDAKANSQQSSNDSNQSQSKSLMQALKNLLSNSASQQTTNQASQPPPDGQGMSQSGNSRQPGASEGDRKGDSRGSSDGQQKASKNSSSGAGSQQGNKDLRKDPSAQSVNAVPDRVALESNGFKEQVRVRTDAGTGTAQLPVRDISPTATAVVNGAEQENIPARYRLYVQRYFEHGDHNVQK